MGSLSINHRVGDEEQAAVAAAAECQSFTFVSCSNFASSSLRFFSDCDGVDSDSDSYIEIELDRSGAKSECSNRESGSRGEEELLQLRISISSTVPFPELCSSSLQGYQIPEMEFRAINESAVLSGLSLSSSAVGIDGDGRLQEEQRVASGDPGRGSSRGRAKFTAVYRLLNSVASSLKVSPEMCQQQDGVSLCEDSRHCRQQQPMSKDPSKTTKTRSGAQVMQFLFKFRTMQFRTFLSSLVKNRPFLAKGKALDELSRERRLEETLHFHHKMAKRSGWKVAERSTSNTKMKSCPSSIQCSPINQEIYADHTRTLKGEYGIQAAIAHCKKSLGDVS